MRLLALAACAAMAVVAMDLGEELTPPSAHWSTPAAVLARTPLLFVLLWAAALMATALVWWAAPHLGLDRERATDAAAFAPIVGVAAMSLLDVLGTQLLRAENRTSLAVVVGAAAAGLLWAYRVQWARGRWSWTGAAALAGVTGLWTGHYRIGWERPGALALGVVAGLLVWIVMVRAPTARTAPLVVGLGAVLLAAGTWAWRTPTTRLIGIPSETIGGARGEASAILLLSIDTLRRDGLSIYNPKVTTTPNFDRLAADSVVFDSAYSASSWTLPSATSFMTGETVRTHQTHVVGRRIPDGLTTLAERLSAQGFATAAVVRNPWLTFRTGFQRGFDGYADFAPDSTSVGERLLHELHDHRSSAMLDVTEAWTAQREGQPFFFWLHLLGPHAPYEPLPQFRPAGPPPAGLEWAFGHGGYMAEWRGRHRKEGSVPPPPQEKQEWARALYYAGIRTADRALGRLLDSLEAQGLYERMLIVVVADHGEEIWDHAKLGHGMQLYDEVTRVPLMVKPPGGGAGVVEAPVSTRNVFHTVLDYAGVEADSNCSDGFSLRGLVEGEEEETASRDLLMQSANGQRRQLDGLVADGRKIERSVDDGGLRVYDLATDPGELSALDLPEEERAAVSARLDARLAAADQARDCFGLVEASTEESSRDGEGLEQLRNLGYIQ